MDTVNKRLAAIRERIGVNKSAFAGLIGIEASRYNKLENGNGIPAGDALMLMAENLPTLNLTWLLTGEGTMFRDDKVLLPADPAPAQPTAVLTPVAESSELKEVKRDRDKWRDMALGLMEELRQRPQRQLVVTGTDGGSFPSGSAEPAEALANRAQMGIAA